METDVYLLPTEMEVTNMNATQIHRPFSVTFPHPLTAVRIRGTLVDNTQGIIVSGLVCGTSAAHEKHPDKNASDKRVRTIVSRLVSFLDGNPEDFAEVALAMGSQSAFQHSVIEAVRHLPYGNTCSYSELAVRAGYPNAVRAAASVVRANRIPLLIPCHRVIRKDGSSGGYCGMQTGPDVVLKKKLLQQEKLALQQ